jgi:hypothetical protein
LSISFPAQIEYVSEKLSLRTLLPVQSPKQ